jgi:hypothetical protein
MTNYRLLPETIKIIWERHYKNTYLSDESSVFIEDLLDAQCLADQQEHEVEKRQVAEEIFKEVEKLYKERLSTKSHPELTWYNWWHDLKAKYGKS